MQVRNSLLHFFRPSFQPPSGEPYYRHRLLHKLSALKLHQFSRKGLDQLSILSSLFLYMSLTDRDGFQGWFELELGLFSLHHPNITPPQLTEMGIRALKMPIIAQKRQYWISQEFPSQKYVRFELLKKICFQKRNMF